MTTYQGQLATLILPEFGLPTVEPTIPATVYRQRMTSFRQRLHADGYDVAIVYGDREHFANLTYLTGYDPRFEEALLVVDIQRGMTEYEAVELMKLNGLPHWNGAPGRCPPGDWQRLLYQQHRGRHCTGRRRAPRRLRAALP